MIHRLPSLIALSWNQMIGIAPVIRFNYDLYKKLVSKCPTSQVEAGAGDPKVIFEDGPIDGVLGSFDLETKELKIDALEIMISTLETQDVLDSDKFAASLDQKLTQVLAHEGGHWHLDKHNGYWAKAEKVAIFFLLLVVGAVLSLILAGVAGSAMGGRIANITQELNPFWSWVVTVILYGFETIVLFTFLRFAFIFWKNISFMITYKICYHERFARKFEGNVDLNPEWKDVVVVEM